MRYRISRHIEFLHPEVCLTAQQETSVLQDRIIIRDKRNKDCFAINSTIETFVKKFTVPATFAEVTGTIATEVNAPVDNVKKVITPFFKYSKYRHFIVPENVTEEDVDSVPLFAVDSLFDNYKIEKIIDTNGNVDVYRATDLDTNSSIAIKLLKHPDKHAIEALKREFFFLKALDTTSVAPIAYTFVEKVDYAYFAQEFIEGLSLPQFIRCRKNTTKKQVLAIASEIIKAFAQIHTNYIVHGDIHPSNIIITNKTNIKIIDFGLATHQEKDKEELINFGGAYFFMPPERINKTTYKKFTKKPDCYSDVFQLGVVLYVLLYNAYPFNGMTWEELATEIKGKQVAFPQTSQYGFVVPEWLKNIINTCVAKKPAARFANAQELYHAFSKKWLNNAGKIRSAAKV